MSSRSIATGRSFKVPTRILEGPLESGAVISILELSLVRSEAKKGGGNIVGGGMVRRVQNAGEGESGDLSRRWIYCIVLHCLCRVHIESGERSSRQGGLGCDATLCMYIFKGR